ncbi:MAG: hypothetical protein AAGI23_07340 [Bacteroidota bacterium]
MIQAKHLYSKLTFFCCAALMLYAAAFYYPKWEKPYTEATLSWDVSGYYLYLPAAFIHQDLKQLVFMPEVLETYVPTPDFQQAYQHESGNYVMKYPIGLAVLYSPFFLTAHAIATTSPDYAADGFSHPYQVAIGVGSLLIAILGLWLLRTILLRYFNDKVVASTLFLLVFATNFLEYGSITAAMTHSWLFTFYTLVIWLTIKFYERPTYFLSAAIGLCVGLMALTRPTEIIACLIPILWGVTNWKSLLIRFDFIQKEYKKLLLAVIVCLGVASLQFVYWKYATGDFLVYSYQDQGFSWLNPHFYKGLFSFRAGWLIYTPVMAFALIGSVPLFKKYRFLFWAIVTYFLIHAYITFAWDIWWYGGSLGQRSMVQAYAALAFPFAAFLEWISRRKWQIGLVTVLSLVFIYMNFWLIHQAHKGGLLRPGNMTKEYFWAIAGKWEAPFQADKLLDINEWHPRERMSVKTLYQNSFDQTRGDSLFTDREERGRVLHLDQTNQFSPVFSLNKGDIPRDAKWLRVNADFFTPAREGNIWNMTQWIIQFNRNGEKVKRSYIRAQRILSENIWTPLYIDVSLPRKEFDIVEVSFWNAGSSKPLLIDDLSIESFQ